MEVLVQPLAAVGGVQHGDGLDGVVLELPEGVHDAELLGVAVAEVEVEQTLVDSLPHVAGVVRHSKPGQGGGELQLLLQDPLQHLLDGVPGVLLVKVLAGRRPPVQPVVPVDEVVGEADVGVLHSARPDVGGGGQPGIAELLQHVDHLGQQLGGVLAHLLPVGTGRLNGEGLVKVVDKAMELLAVNDVEGDEVAADQLQQQLVKLLLDCPLRIHFGELAELLDDCWLPYFQPCSFGIGLTFSFGRISLALLRLDILPHFLVRLLQMVSYALSSPIHNLVLRDDSLLRAHLAFYMLSIQTVLKVLPNLRLWPRWHNLTFWLLLSDGGGGGGGGGVLRSNVSNGVRMIVQSVRFYT